MKRLILAAGLAVVLHSLFLNMEAGWIDKRAIYTLRPEPIALSLHYQYTERIPSPVVKRAEEIHRPLLHIKKEEKMEKAIQNPTPKSPKKIKSWAEITRVQSSKPEKEVQPEVPLEWALPPEPESSPDHQGSEWDEEERDLFPNTSLEMPQGSVSEGIEDIASVPSTPAIREAIPAYRKNPRPKYPRWARRRGYQGTVVLEVLVDREGGVGDLRLFQSSGHSMLDRAAIASVKNWLFEPGRRGNKRVEMWVKVPIRYQLR